MAAPSFICFQMNVVATCFSSRTPDRVDTQPCHVVSLDESRQCSQVAHTQFLLGSCRMKVVGIVQTRADMTRWQR